MSVILELFAYILFEIFFPLPGAFVRWSYFKFTGKNKSFKEVLTNRSGTNAFISIGMLMIIVLIITFWL